jgi:poly-beta-1,6-N-acetyl-D-glucosamine synthase
MKDLGVGRKVRTLAGNYQILAMMPRLLVPFLNPSWFETWSQRILRLACPWTLAILLVTSAMAVAHGPTVWAITLLFRQLLFYGMALAGGRLGRVGKVARTFVVLNAAAVVGLWRYLVGAQKVTW